MSSNGVTTVKEIEPSPHKGKMILHYAIKVTLTLVVAGLVFIALTSAQAPAWWGFVLSLVATSTIIILQLFWRRKKSTSVEVQ